MKKTVQFICCELTRNNLLMITNNVSLVSFLRDGYVV